MPSTYDVVICGGGLAGLTLARQVRREAPRARVLVCEKRSQPAREAAFKVGESTVEIGAHYLRRIVDLEEVLVRDHLPKMGLRYYFTGGDNRDLTSRFELGSPSFPRVPSFQIDRGRLENTLTDMVRDADVTLLSGARVKEMRLGADTHAIQIDTPSGVQSIEARWLVDATGRAGLLKTKLSMRRTVAHRASACWFRVPLRLKVDDWSDNPSWQRRVPNGQRWLSTTHLMGKGYWVWLIPLGSGSTSVGIVADSDVHPFDRISRFERALEWLYEFEPQCAAVVESQGARRQDFLALKHFAHGCERVFSPDRWAMVGESGVFTDPFYSPGSDFIAIGNDFTTDLVRRDLGGEDVRQRAESFNIAHLRLFDAFLKLYEQQYPAMGHAQVMTAKVSWDNATYWAVPALLYFQRRLVRPEFMTTIEPLMRRFFVLHARMQQLFIAWGKAEGPSPASGHANVLNVDRLRQLQGSLDDPLQTDEALRTRLEDNVSWLETLAFAWQQLAAGQNPALRRFVSDPGSRTDGCTTQSLGALCAPMFAQA